MGERKRKRWTAPWNRPWTPSRLMSRKLALATFAVLVAIGADLAGHALSSATLSLVQNIVLAYIAVQGAVDYRATKLSTDWMTGNATTVPGVDPAGGDA
jgi:hypothetical protein